MSDTQTEPLAVVRDQFGHLRVAVSKKARLCIHRKPLVSRDRDRTPRTLCPACEWEIPRMGGTPSANTNRRNL